MDTLAWALRSVLLRLGGVGVLRALAAAMRRLAVAVEPAEQTLERLMFLVSEVGSCGVRSQLIAQNLESAVIKTGMDLGLFGALHDHGTPLSVVALARTTGGDPMLLARLLRYLASKDLVVESGTDAFTANRTTALLAQADSQSGFYHYYDHVNPQFQALPGFLAQTKYRNVTDGRATVFQATYGTQQTVFEWYPRQQPDTFAHFNRYMASRRRALPTWLSAFSLHRAIAESEAGRPISVDVAGGTGQQCADVLAMYPRLAGRVVLEDLDHCIQQALPTPGVEKRVQDIFQPQQVQGAKFYHLRGVLHDFPDAQCREILRNLRPALRPDSRILIEEHVLPDVGVHWQATQLDLTMLCGLGAMERTRTQFDQLLVAAGLRILHIYPVGRSTYESVIVAAVAD